MAREKLAVNDAEDPAGVGLGMGSEMVADTPSITARAGGADQTTMMASKVTMMTTLTRVAVEG
jgi:hypothetical protein